MELLSKVTEHPSKHTISVCLDESDVVLMTQLIDSHSLFLHCIAADNHLQVLQAEIKHEACVSCCLTKLLTCADDQLITWNCVRNPSLSSEDEADTDTAVLSSCSFS